MKKYITKILLISFTTLISYYTKAQTIVDCSNHQGDTPGIYYKDIQHHFDPFLGTWEYQNGNEIFKIHLHKVEHETHRPDDPAKHYADQIYGSFELIEIVNPPNQSPYENVIHNSQILFGDHAFFASSRDGSVMKGRFFDSSAGAWLALTFTIIPNTNPVQAEWKVKTIHPAFGTNFNVPENCFMTKIN